MPNNTYLPLGTSQAFVFTSIYGIKQLIGFNTLVLPLGHNKESPIRNQGPQLFTSLYGRSNWIVISTQHLWRIMDNKEFNKAFDEATKKKMLEEPDIWFKPRRQRWDEWGSPVGLSLGWALFIIPLGVFLWLLHLAGLIG